jgi:predicted HTH transcriptional regulator
LHTREGKAKFLKHICALSNSNPASYIVVGVEDQDNEIVGDFFDDSHIQNLVNAYLENPPKIQYENVLPQLTKRQSDWTSDRKTKK